MSEFWWGVLALPIIVAALAVAAIAVFGAWCLLELWGKRRFNRLRAVKVSENAGAKFSLWTQPQTGLRGALTSMLLTGTKGFMMQLSTSTALIILHGIPDDPSRARILNKALERAIIECSKEEAGQS
jgi:hypothetical protein